MKTTFAAAVAVCLLAAPAFAAEEYQTGPALTLADHVASRDTGSAQSPAFDGETAIAVTLSPTAAGNSAEASVETRNSEPGVAFGRNTNTILAQR